MPSRFALGFSLLLAASPGTAQAPTPEMAARAEQGKQAMAAGHFDEAAAIYAEIVKVLPNEPGMRLNLGVAHAMAGRPAEATAHLEAALKVHPNLVPAALFLGAAHMQLGRPARAVAPLEKVVAAEPANVQARQMLADALLALGRWEAASRQFRKLTEVAPDRAAHWFGLGRSYEAIAGEAFARLERTAPESEWIMLLTAQGLASEGRYANAYRLYREALARRPSVREAHEALADIYEKTGHADWAAAERARATASPPPDCRPQPLECDYRANRHLAVLATARRTKGAEADYWAARSAGELARAAFVRLEQLPPSAETALVRGEVLGRQQRHVEAVAELRRATQAFPQDARLRRELARALYRARDLAAARPLLEELRRGDPESAELAFLLGDVLLKQQQPETAVPHLEQAVAREPKMLVARAALGGAHLQARRPADAIPHLAVAAEIDEDGSLHYQLSRAYQAAGQSEPAAQALRKSQELRQSSEARQRQMEEEFKITPP